MDRHIRITYALKRDGADGTAGISFDYRIKPSAADELERTLHEWVPDAVITIDDYVTDELRIIPCAELWEPL